MNELRQIDRQIAEMLGWRIEEYGENFYKQKLYHVWTPEGKQVGYWTLGERSEWTHAIPDLTVFSDHVMPKMFPYYSTDLNAALSLIIGKPGLHWKLEGGELGCYIVRIYQIGVADVHEYDTPEPALALCKAWLVFMQKAKSVESEPTP